VTIKPPPGEQRDEVAYMSHLELRREPFAPLNDEDFFYAETQRAKCLKFLLHLVPYSDALLLTGGPGSGKTCLMQQVIAQSSPSWRICQIEADIAIDVNTVLQKLAEVFLFDASPDLSLERRVSNMHKMLKAQRNSALAPVVIIDDAHLVGLPILHFLGSLLDYDIKEDRLLCIVLVGRTEMKERLEIPSLELLRSKISHSFELLPFSAEDTRGYIQHRLSVAGGTGDAVFTSAVFSEIHEESGGVPGKINVSAMHALRGRIDSKGPTPQPLTSVMERLALPWRKIGIVSAVVVFGAIILLQDKINQSIEPEVKEEGVNVTANPPETLASSKVTRLPWEDPPPDASDEQPAMQQALGAAEDIPISDAGTPGQGTGTPGHTLKGTGGTGTKDNDDQGGRAAAENVADNASPPAAVQPIVASQPDTGSDMSGQAVLPETDDDIEKTDDQVVPVSTPVEESVDQSGEESSLRREDWILSRNPRHFTVQLMAMDEPKVVRLVSQWGLSEDVAYYQTDRALLAVLYGDFSSRQEGEAAAGELLKDIRGIKPWVRTFSAVQAKIRVTDAPVTASTPGPGVAAEVSADRARLRADEDRLLARNPQHYTLQLMAMDLDAVTKRVNKWGVESQAVYFRTLKLDKELVAVTYGDYPARNDAIQDSKRLTRKIKGITPWIRQFGSIHDSITEFRTIAR